MISTVHGKISQICLSFSILDLPSTSRWQKPGEDPGVMINTPVLLRFCRDQTIIQVDRQSHLRHSRRTGLAIRMVWAGVVVVAHHQT